LGHLGGGRREGKGGEGEEKRKKERGLECDLRGVKGDRMSELKI
jgi:hypothetical protein